MISEFLNDFSQFHFLRPWVLLLILPLIFYWRLLNTNTVFSSWENVCDRKLLRFLLIKGRNTSRKVGNFLFIAACLLGSLAASGPSWKEIPTPALTGENPVMFVLNLSSDMMNNDVSPNRLDRAKIEITDILDQTPDVQSGLIVYTSEPFVISPLSDDPELVKNLLGAVNLDSMPANGDFLERAIILAAERLQSAGYTHGHIIVLTPEAGMTPDLSIKAAENAAASGFMVDVMNISTQKNTELQKVAAAGKGAYFPLSSASASEVSEFLKSSSSSKIKEGENMASRWEDYGYYLMFGAIFCVLCLFRKGVFVLIFCVALSFNAEAGWFFSDEKEAMDAFKQGDFNFAASKFTDPAWAGASLYRNENYEAAIKAFSKTKDTEGLYNLGNALAKSGKIEEAIKTYEDVLEQQPDHEDAKFNLEYLKQQQQNQQQNQSQNNDNEQQQDQEQNQSQAENSSSEQDDNPENKEQNKDQSGDNNQSQDEQQEDQDPQDQDDEQKSEPKESKMPKADQTDESKEEASSRQAGQQQDEDKPYDEEVQAREQRFRDIPEDKGGLLRAFIYKEFIKNRYGD